MAQIIPSWNWGGGWSWASYTAWNWIDITSNEISIDTSVVAEKTDLSWFQTTANMVTSLTWADDDHYPTAKAVADAISWWWSWDVVWPASSTDEDVAIFDWATWKIIKDSGVKLSSKLDASALSDNNYWWAWNGDTTHTPTKNAIYTKLHTMDVEIWNKAADNNVVKLSWNQSVGWTKTFTSEIVLPSKTTAATNDWTKPATEAQVKLVDDDVATNNGMISSNASSSNKLMDKNYIDDSINSVTAYYITKNAQGDQWATYAELSAASTFYSWWVQRTPTRNDYTIVLADENYDNATTRYIYNSGWEYQYTVNETAMSQAQLDALNSWITSWKVSTYDGYSSTISWKQDALTLPSTPTNWHLVTWGANNKTLEDWWAVPTVPTNVSAFNNDAWYLTSSTWVTSVNSNVWAVTVNEVPSGWNNWDVLTNVSWTPTWAAPSWWIENVTTWTTSTVTGIWAGTETEYTNLGTKSWTVLYFTF